VFSAVSVVLVVSRPPVQTIFGLVWCPGGGRLLLPVGSVRVLRNFGLEAARLRVGFVFRFVRHEFLQRAVQEQGSRTDVVISPLRQSCRFTGSPWSSRSVLRDGIGVRVTAQQMKTRQAVGHHEVILELPVLDGSVHHTIGGGRTG